MSRVVSHCNRPFWPSYIALLLFIFILTSMTLQRVCGSPFPNFQPQGSTFESSTAISMSSSTDNSASSSTDGSMSSSTDNSMSSSTDNSMSSSTDNSMSSSTDNSMSSSTDNSMSSSTDNSTEISPYTDVYVIKAVVYEIGILTDTDNTTSESTERQERVDISLYNVPQEDEFS